MHADRHAPLPPGRMTGPPRWCARGLLVGAYEHDPAAAVAPGGLDRGAGEIDHAVRLAHVGALHGRAVEPDLAAGTVRTRLGSIGHLADPAHIDQLLWPLFGEQAPAGKGVRDLAGRGLRLDAVGDEPDAEPSNLALLAREGRTDDVTAPVHDVARGERLLVGRNVRLRLLLRHRVCATGREQAHHQHMQNTHECPFCPRQTVMVGFQK